MATVRHRHRMYSLTNRLRVVVVASTSWPWLLSERVALLPKGRTAHPTTPIIFATLHYVWSRYFHMFHTFISYLFDFMFLYAIVHTSNILKLLRYQITLFQCHFEEVFVSAYSDSSSRPARMSLDSYHTSRCGFLIQ